MWHCIYAFARSLGQRCMSALTQVGQIQSSQFQRGIAPRSRQATSRFVAQPVGLTLGAACREHRTKGAHLCLLGASQEVELQRTRAHCE